MTRNDSGVKNMSQLIELGHGELHSSPSGGQFVPVLPGMVLRSAGPFRHSVSLGFHDSQMRGRALLVDTGWSERLGTDMYGVPGPYLSEEFVFRLIRSEVQLVGTDFPIASDASKDTLLSKHIRIVDQLDNFAVLPRAGFRLHIVALDSPKSGIPQRVRAYAEIL